MDVRISNNKIWGDEQVEMDDEEEADKKLLLEGIEVGGGYF